MIPLLKQPTEEKIEKIINLNLSLLRADFQIPIRISISLEVRSLRVKGVKTGRNQWRKKQSIVLTKTISEEKELLGGFFGFQARFRDEVPVHLESLDMFTKEEMEALSLRISSKPIILSLDTELKM
ncbi:hypothetical protein MKW98_005168 [Papaver atlanticum]|uniref:Uncharacterized protein n=1 Tax=Papaver atlanticum TaxID=357466 RepID=A0AAD4RXC4_9MAGN|nr:hypothetical protein MKW98_005168 [Papaver atlanticum]